MEVIRETLWKRCLSIPIKLPAKNNNICLSETAYQHKGTRKKCKKTNQATIIQWQRQCLMDEPHRKPWPKSKTSDISKQSPSHCITPFCSDALVSPSNLYPPWWWAIVCAILHKSWRQVRLKLPSPRNVSILSSLILQCWRRTGHLLSFFSSPPRRIWQLKSPHPREFAIQGKKMLIPGGQPGAGGEGWAQVELTDALSLVAKFWLAVLGGHN